MRGWVTGLHRRHWEALQAALGATAVMTKFSTVVSALMHNPELADVMQRLANGDATSVNAFTRTLIAGWIQASIHPNLNPNLPLLHIDCKSSSRSEPPVDPVGDLPDCHSATTDIDSHGSR